MYITINVADHKLYIEYPYLSYKTKNKLKKSKNYLQKL